MKTIKYPTPSESYATAIYNSILENGSTTKYKCGLRNENEFRTGAAEFRDHPWKYDDRALICSDPYAGIFKFAETLEEIDEYLRWHCKYVSTREYRTLRVTKTYKKGYGSTPRLDHMIMSMQYLGETTHFFSETGLYIAG